MILEILLLIALLYIYTLYQNSKRTQDAMTQVEDIQRTDAETQTEHILLPLLSLNASTQTNFENLQSRKETLRSHISTTASEQPIIKVTVTEKAAHIDVIPPWFDPVPIPNLKQIRLPPTFDLQSPPEKQQIEVISTYRSMNNKSLNFVETPFVAEAKDTETLLVVLNQVVIRPMRAYRTACGIIDLGNIHSLFTAENDIRTAKFRWNFDDKLKYEEIKRTPKTLKEFILTFIAAIATKLGCRPEFIRVFGLSNDDGHGEKLSIDFGITTQSETETKRLAEQLQSAAAAGLFQKQGDDSILCHVIPNFYELKLEPTIRYLQLQMSDLEPIHNRDYASGSYPHEVERGSHPYYLPIGWFRHALKVEDKYPQDKFWLGMRNHRDEWIVAYHGTNAKAVKDIARGGFSQSRIVRDVCRVEAIIQVGSVADVPGIYLATHCEGGAAGYSKEFSVKNNDGKSVDFDIVFQCRVQPKKYTEHTRPVTIGTALRVFDGKAVRPYGLLLKQTEQRCHSKQPKTSSCCIA